MWRPESFLSAYDRHLHGSPRAVKRPILLRNRSLGGVHCRGSLTGPARGCEVAAMAEPLAPDVLYSPEFQADPAADRAGVYSRADVGRGSRGRRVVRAE